VSSLSRSRSTRFSHTLRDVRAMAPDFATNRGACHRRDWLNGYDFR
jgi:hypothetical protein